MTGDRARELPRAGAEHGFTTGTSAADRLSGYQPPGDYLSRGSIFGI